MVKIVSPRAELTVLRGILSKDKKIAGTLLSQVDETYFHSEESLEVYDLVKKHMRESGESPTLRILMHDPDLTGEAKTFLKSGAGEVKLETTDEAKKAARILNKYRVNRGLYNIAAAVSEQLQRKKFDQEKLIDQVSQAVAAVRSGKANEASFYHFGKNNNTMGMVDNILFGDRTDDLIATGIEPFDDMAGGLPRGGLFVVGATTGGGKSVLGSALAVKMAEMGRRVLLVPLEMSEVEMTCRIMACVTGVKLTKFTRQIWEPGEAEAVKKKFKKWLKKVKKKGGQYTIYKPPTDVDAEDIFNAIATMDYDVCIIDYIGLLKGTGGDDQWRALGSIARQAKVNAEHTGRVNVLLCQVSDEGKIRYAQAIAEHANNAWTWVATPESKETGLTRVVQLKARNSATTPFYIKIDYAHMQVTGVKQEELGTDDLGAVQTHDDDGKGDPVNKKGKKGKKDKGKAKGGKKERLVNLASDI